MEILTYKLNFITGASVRDSHDDKRIGGCRIDR